MVHEKFFYEDLDPESDRTFIENFTTPYRKKYVKCEKFILPQSIKNFADAIDEVEIRDDDIWVCTFPKSGTTWTQEMVWCLVNGLDHADVKKHINHRYLYLEFSALFDDAKSLGLPENSVKNVEKLASPRFIKTHLPFNLLPKNIRNFSTNAKVIHVSRNPRDTMISFYHHCKLLRDYKGSFPEFVELFLKGTVPYGPFPAYLKGYLEHENNPRILFLKYEEMKKDLKSVIQKTANFIGKTISEDEVEKLLGHLSFSSMKENAAVNHKSVVDMKKKLHSDDKDKEDRGEFMRKGIVGEWKERLGPELCERFQEWEREALNGIDFTFSV